MNFLANFILKDAKIIADKINFGEIKGKRILITGGTGLIGHYTIAAINQASKQGYTPKNLYITCKSAPPEYFKELLKGLPATIIQGDLTSDPNIFADVSSIDYTIHAAGYGQPGKFMENPIVTLKLNTLGTWATLEKTKSDGKYIFMSTSEVYSGLSHTPFKEDQIGTTNTDHFRACYIEGKRCGEAIVNTFRMKGQNARSARLSLVYGPGTRKNDARVLNNFIQKGLTSGSIDLLDTGDAIRTYIYITDAVELIFNILFSGTDALYNVGGISKTTIADLAKIIGKHLNVPVKFPADTGHQIQGAPNEVSLDMKKSQRQFNKKDFISLEEGLKRTIDWQSKLY